MKPPAPEYPEYDNVDRKTMHSIAYVFIQNFIMASEKGDEDPESREYVLYCWQRAAYLLNLLVSKGRTEYEQARDLMTEQGSKGMFTNIGFAYSALVSMSKINTTRVLGRMK